MTAGINRSGGAVMQSAKRVLSVLGACVVAVGLSGTAATAAFAGASAEPQAAAPNAARQVVGVIKAIRGNVIAVAPDSGAEANIEVRTNVRVLRVAPGETNLAKAAPIQFSDLQVGDRVLVQATPGADAQSLVATRVIAMKKTDVDAKQEADRQDWQKRGIAGLVSAVDPSAGVLAVSAGGAGGSRTIAVHTTKDTSVRRYAPDSVRFDDAVPGAVAQIKAGDQLRARGTRNADGSELAAEEIIAGTFRNISGVISAVDAAANSITVNDLVTKKPVVVKVSAQSQITKLTPEAAQGVAARAKAAAGAGAAAGAPGTGGGVAGGAGAGRGAGGGGRGGGGQADLQQVINRMPPATLADFAKGEAVMVVSTEGTATGGVTAIMLVGGVEPILAAPNGAQQTLAPWDLGGGGGDAGQ
jgi:Domain of unknown function (DUF5666)